MPNLLQNLILATAFIGIAACNQEETAMQDTQLDPPPPAEVTPEIFSKWRDARRGTHQAEPQNNPYWQWILESKTSAYSANLHFAGPSSFGGNPAWEANRFGQSKTTLPDGRQILIAGEHEDHYDPDFFIYNDVIIRHPEGTVEFLTYPIEEFTPTDFHTATLVDENIILIGNLGYRDDRKPDLTQILLFDTKTWQITKQASSGNNPGWIHRHRAELSEDKKSILVTGGTIHPADPDHPLIENIDDWRLHLKDWSWERLTERNWPLFEITRSDGERNQLWHMRHALREEKFGKPNVAENFKELGVELDAETLKELEKQSENPLPKDRKALEQLYQPATVPHKQIPEREIDEDDEDDFSELGVTRIEVEGVTIHYKEASYKILVTIEGELPKETIKALVADLVNKLKKVEGVDYKSKQLRP